MFWLFQLKRKRKDVSMTLAKMGGYRMACQVAAEDRMALRPKNRYISVGLH